MSPSLIEFNELYFKANSFFGIQEYLGLDHKIEEQHPAILELMNLEPYLLRLSDFKDSSNLSETKIEGVAKVAQYRHKMIEIITEYAIHKGIVLDSAVATKTALFLDSYNRPAYLLQLHKILSFDEWMKIFVAMWTNCDGCSMYINEFKAIFKDKDLPLLMKTYFDSKHYNKWKQLKKTFIVYRGAFESCQNGLSWTQDDQVAINFSNQYLSMSNKGMCYLRALTQMNESGMELIDKKVGEAVSVYAIMVKKEDCLLFLNRNEQEVLVPNCDNYEIADVLVRN